MKEVATPIFKILIFIAATALVVFGFIKLAVAIYFSLPIAEPIMLTVLGFILIELNLLRTEVYTVIKYFAQTVELITKAREDYAANTGDTSAILVSFGPNTPPEELKSIKEKYPFLSNEIDRIVNMTKKKTLAELSMEELIKKRDKAIENNDFEKAAEIRDEINRRK